MYGEHLVNPGTGSTYIQNYGTYGGNGSNYYADSLGGAVNEILKKVLGGAYTLTIGAAFDSLAAHFNSQLGKIMAEANYGAGQGFYIKEGSWGMWEVYDTKGNKMGTIDPERIFPYSYGY